VFKEEGEQNLSSVMMMEDFFSATREDLRGKYTQQSTQIIKDTITHCHKLRYQEGCFELLGFDFLMNSQGKLFLLEVNLNPACASSRDKKLKEETEAMAQTML
jgi:D-alanine-D-alanine ligase-like ATP-grasp enzyme